MVIDFCLCYTFWVPQNSRCLGFLGEGTVRLGRQQQASVGSVL